MKIMKDDRMCYSKELYPEACIESAIRAYDGIAKITIIQNKTYHICQFSNCIADNTLVMNEFGNYLIELLNEKRDQ